VDGMRDGVIVNNGEREKVYNLLDTCMINNIASHNTKYNT